MAARMLRWGLPRDPRAVPHLVAFVVAAVATVLIVRGLLAATGYPQLGGRGLHVAHVLWGGLLLAVALFLLLSFLGPGARPAAALIGGAGFGLFIDEVGKFVTADTDYFFRPALAIMYVIFVLFVLAVHWLDGRRPLQAVEYLAGAVDEAVAGLAGGLAPARRAAAGQRLALAGQAPGADEVAALLDRLPDDPHGHRPGGLGNFLAIVQHRVLGSRVALLAAVVLLVGQTVTTLLGLGALGMVVLRRPGGQLDQVDSFAAAATTVGAAVSALCVVVGLVHLRHDRPTAYAWLQRAVLVDLLVTRVFALALHEFAALPSVLLDLLLLAVLASVRARDAPPAAADSGS